MVREQRANFEHSRSPMGNRSRKTAATDRNHQSSGEDQKSPPPAFARQIASSLDSVVLLEARRGGRASQPLSDCGRLDGEAVAASPSGKEIGEQIGKELRELYADLVAQPVPKRFIDLLNQLEEKTISSQTTPKSPGER
jgi:hypothetical protein